MNKYHKKIKGVTIDVYDVLQAFEVTSQPLGHAIKKLLMPGKRGHKDTITDLKEAQASIEREIEMLTPPKQYQGLNIQLASLSKELAKRRLKKDSKRLKQAIALTKSIKLEQVGWHDNSSRSMPFEDETTVVEAQTKNGNTRFSQAKNLNWHIESDPNFVVKYKVQPSFVVKNDGWIEHDQSSESPVDKNTRISFMTEDAEFNTLWAKHIDWTQVVKYQIKQQKGKQ